MTGVGKQQVHPVPYVKANIDEQTYIRSETNGSNININATVITLADHGPIALAEVTSWIYFTAHSLSNLRIYVKLGINSATMDSRRWSTIILKRGKSNLTTNP